VLNKNVREYLNKLNKEIENCPNSEFKITEEIKNIFKKEGESYRPTDEDIAEQMAFNFLAEYPNDNFSWGTYYGPMAVLPDQQGQMFEYPSIQKVTKEILAYWESRAKSTENSILTARYADLVIDFSPKILQKKADYKLFQLVIDQTLIICNKLLVEPLDCKTKIKRALNLSIETNDKKRISEVKKAIITLEEKISEDSKAGLWGFAFKWLLLDFDNKIEVTPQEKNTLISGLEKKLEKVNENPWSVEQIVSLLAEYYAKKRNETDLIRVLKVLEKVFKEDVRTNSDPLLKINAFEQIHEIYQKYRDKGFPEAKKATDRISQEIGSLNLDWNKSLKKISVTTSVEKEKISNVLKYIFGKEKQDALEIILVKIVINFLPKQKDIKSQFQEHSKNHILQFLCTTQIISEEWIPIAKLSTFDKDYDKHFQNYASRYLQFGAFFLAIVIDELKNRITKNEMIEYFQKASIFEKENKEYIRRAVQAFWDNDYLISSHLFIPLIESAIGYLIRVCGGNILVPNNLSGYDRLSLSTLLKNQGNIIKEVFSEIEEDMSFYFRLVLTEKLGMNLRNNFAHGLGKKAFFSREAADRLFHVLLCLTLVKKLMSEKL
jgi:hypothetical protein